MTAPNPTLTRLYGNEETFLEKQAGLVGLSGRVALALITMKALDSFHSNMVDHQIASQAQAELLRRDPGMDDVVMRMRYSHPPVMIAPLTHRSAEQSETEYGLGVMPGAPVGMDSGMIRLAMVAGSIGERMAKKAGVGPGMFARMGASIPIIGKNSTALGWKGKAMGLGTAAVGAYGLVKGVQKVTGWGSEEAKPTNWSHTDYGAPKLVKNVNEYGYT